MPTDKDPFLIRFRDGSSIKLRRDTNPPKFVAFWSDDTPLRSDGDETSCFETVQEALDCLAAAGEGHPPTAVFFELQKRIKLLRDRLAKSEEITNRAVVQMDKMLNEMDLDAKAITANERLRFALKESEASNSRAMEEARLANEDAARLAESLTQFVKDCGESAIQNGLQGEHKEYVCNGCRAYRTVTTKYRHNAGCRVAKAIDAIAAHELIANQKRVEM